MYSDVELMEAYERAPYAIKKALNDGVAADFIIGIRKRYGFHLDTVSKVIQLIRNTLLGLAAPTDFLGQLTAIGIPEGQARVLITDVNTEVFMPIQKMMRDGISEEDDEEEFAKYQVAPAQPPAVAPPEPVAQAQAPVMSVSEPAPTVQPFASATPAPQPQAPIAASVQDVPPVAVQQPVPAALDPSPIPIPVARQPGPMTPPPYTPPAPMPHARTMASDMELIEHGYDALRVPGMPLPQNPSLATPARTFQTASVPITDTAQAMQAPTPPPLPQRVVPPPPAYGPVVTAPVRLTPVERAHPDAPITKEYGSDPYREPITG
jgi:hypothetical protein